MLVIRETLDETRAKVKNRPKDDIYLIENLILNKHCDIIRENLDKYATVEEKVFNELTNVKSYVSEDPHLIVSRTMSNEIIKPLMSKIKTILEYKYYILVEGYQKIELRKIYGDTKFHIDDVHQKKNDFSSVRQIACIICLNDDYDGGELVFPCQNRRIKLKKGQILLFPPYWTHPHYSEKLENGTFRYTLNTWFFK